MYQQTIDQVEKMKADLGLRMAAGARLRKLTEGLNEVRDQLRLAQLDDPGSNGHQTAATVAAAAPVAGVTPAAIRGATGNNWWP